MSTSTTEHRPSIRHDTSDLTKIETLNPRVNPVINTPFEEPAHHWELDFNGRALDGQPPKPGRRPSLGVLPLPRPTKGQVIQGVLQLHPDNYNQTVNDIRDHLRVWRRRQRHGATDLTRRLLAYWTRDNRHLRPFFAQLEAVETVIWLTETPEGRKLAKKIASRSQELNDGITRWAIKMATGTGKTMVMAMLIAWHTLNDARRHGGRRRRAHPYTSSFLAITPGHTVRERLAELVPSHPRNVYDQMDLVPRSLRARLNRARVAVVNFQAFQRRDVLSGVSRDARKVLDPHGEQGTEDAAAMLDRVLRSVRGNDRLLVLNDEAHHCYNPSIAKGSADDDKVAGLWFNAIHDLYRQKRLLATYDFSATPMFITTTARKHGGDMFPWVISDFPLMDAIESGLVKIPRLPVDDDAEGFDVKWRAIYKNATPKKVTRQQLPGILRDALESLYMDWCREWEKWRKAGRRTPPVFIVVANSISNAQALYEYIAGYELEDETGRIEFVRGRFAEFSNVRIDSTGWEDTPVTLLMHSKLDSENKLTGAFARLVKQQATRLSGLRRRTDATDDVSLLRNVLNTVGREGEPGDRIRCVISVQMLTEGWDTRTVTHVLGYRAFSTQLLCEQVTGRALRRADYESFDSHGRLIPEYSQVLGIPFDFMPTGPVGGVAPPKPTYTVRTMPGKSDLRIEFPRLAGYAWRPGTQRLRLDPAKVDRYDASRLDLPTLAELQGVAGSTELVGIDDVRNEQVKWTLAAACTRRVIDRSDSDGLVIGRRQLFMDLHQAVSEWLAHPNATYHDPAVLLRLPHLEDIAGRVISACSHSEQGPYLEGTFEADGPFTLNTSDVDFETTLGNRYPGPGSTCLRSELNIAACHSRLEVQVAQLLDTFDDVEAWARNFRLGWEVPYLHDGVWRIYEPDFVVRLRSRNGQTIHLIVECKGVQDNESSTKARYVKDWWVPAVAQSPQIPPDLRRWGFVEITDSGTAYSGLADAIRRALSSSSPESATTGRN